MLDRPSDVVCDKQGVVNNTILTQYTLSNKHNAIKYYVVCKADALGILWVVKEDIEKKLDDLLTKILGWQQHPKLLQFFIIQVKVRKGIYK